MLYLRCLTEFRIRVHIYKRSECFIVNRDTNCASIFIALSKIQKTFTNNALKNSPTQTSP